MTASIEERCKQKGVKLTDQRKLIAQIMLIGIESDIVSHTTQE